MSLSSTVNSLSTAYMVGKMAWNVFNKKTTSAASLAIQDKPYRPIGWPATNMESDTSEELMLKASNFNQQLYQPSDKEAPGYNENDRIGFFFDAFIKESHTGSVRITEHPVQTGSNISDHAYNLPDKLTIEIFVSDVMDEVIKDQFSEYDTKSVSAYEVLRTLKEQRQPLEINTRIRYYEDMMIESMTISEDYKTKNSLRCSVALRQVMMARVAKEVAIIPNKKNTSDKQNSGTKGADTRSSSEKAFGDGR